MKLVHVGVIKPKEKGEIRYWEITRALYELHKLYPWKYMAIEKQYVAGRYGNSILKVSEVVGVCKAVHYSLVGTEVFEIMPQEAKKIFGIADRKRKQAKLAMIEAVQRHFQLETVNNDEADAVAIALAGLKKLSWKMLPKK